MIEKISIRNWQSLTAVDLDLGPLTVILGESNVGKSSLMRAARAVASNVRGPGYITRGERAFAVTVHTATHIVTLERGAGDGGLYRVVDTTTGTEQTYTKLGGAVPAAVTAALGLLPAGGAASLNFAGQFDPPYLLDDTGAAVARVIGSLTKVDIILRAVSEANRRRLALLSTLRTREADLAEKTARAVALARTLPPRVAARKAAEGHAEAAAVLAERAGRLRSVSDALVVAESVLARCAPAAPLPEPAAMVTAAARLARYKALVRDWAGANNAVAAAARTAQLSEAAELAAQAALDDALRRAGYCPVCNQRVAHTGDDHRLS